MLKVDWNLLFNIINILVLYLLLKRFLFKPVTSIMEKRSNTVKASLEDAESKNIEAARLKQEYEEAIRKAEVQAADIILEAKDRAAREQERQQKEAAEAVAKLKEDMRKTIELEQRLALEKLKSEVAGIAILAASKVIQSNITADANRKLIDDFLSEAGEGK
jgi:F-type H+-transporting ATPase subunit b